MTEHVLATNEHLVNDFEELARRVAGVEVHPKWRRHIPDVLDRAAASAGAPSVEAYFRELATRDDLAEQIRRLVGQTTVKETSFFRAPEQFDVLTSGALPEIELYWSDARMGGPCTLPLRVWSAGCATGEETYSIAMALLDAIRYPRSWSFEVVGTDLSEEAVAQARSGRYSHVALGAACPERYGELLDAHTRREKDAWQMDERVRSLVRFEVSDIFAAESPRDQDVVFCRNLLIYFSLDRQQVLVERLWDALRPGGWLFLGEAELLHVMSHRFEECGGTRALAYRKPLDCSELPGGGAPRVRKR